jgi:2-oxoglutarate ferredoxin oxidoreductase subunit delta
MEEMDQAVHLPTEEKVVTQRSRHGPRGQVVIFGTWCKGCGLCVEFCPVAVLALDSNGHPIVVAPEKCTACHWCDTHCPDLAIIVRPIE